MVEIPTQNDVFKNEMPVPVAVPKNDFSEEEYKKPLYVYGAIALVFSLVVFFLQAGGSLVLDNTTTFTAIGAIFIGIFSLYFSAKLLKIKGANLEKAFFVSVSSVAIENVVLFLYIKIVSTSSVKVLSGILISTLVAFIIGILLTKWAYLTSLKKSVLVLILGQIMSAILVAIVGIAVATLNFSGFN